MIVTHKLEMDLVNRQTAHQIHAVQGDSNTREIALELLSDGVQWEIPDGITAALCYCKSDGTKGSYDTLPNGTKAWYCEGNVLTVILAPQMLTAAGIVQAQVELVLDAKTLATFAFQVNVEASPAAGVLTSEDYTNWLSWMEQELDQRLEEAKESGEFDGPQGIQGPKGEKGDPGKSAYEFARESGYTGTEAEFAQRMASDVVLVNGLLSASGWTEEAAPYRQTLAVPGVKAEKPPHVCPVYSGNAQEDAALNRACGMISYATADDGSVCFICLEAKPGLDIPVQVEVHCG